MGGQRGYVYVCACAINNSNNNNPIHTHLCPDFLQTTRRSNSVALNVEDMCFSNLLRRNSIYSPRPSLSTGHSPKPIRDACRTAILKNASASGVFPESPSEIDVDGLR